MTKQVPYPEYTPEQYFQLLEDAAEKMEYHDGRVVAMAGGSANHSRLCGAIYGELYAGLKASGCSFFTSDMAIKIEKEERYLFPDASIVCGEPLFEDEREMRFMNPTVIIEVLSESTEAYDRGRKFDYYRTLDSLREYILVSSSQVMIESYFREEEELWRITSAKKQEDIFQIRTLGLEIRLGTLYVGTSGIL